MSQISDIERITKNPDLLLELCRSVIEILESEDDKRETAAMEAQLREIARAVEKLEKMGVVVPDAFRAEKTRLAAALSMQSDSSQVLSHLAEGFGDILKDIKARLEPAPKTMALKKTRTKRSRSPKTENKILRELIIDALRQAGGAALKNEVIRYMEVKLKGKLLPGDLEWREATSDYAWQNNTCWERFQMTQEGTLKTGSPRGLWELNEEYR